MVALFLGLPIFERAWEQGYSNPGMILCTSYHKTCSMTQLLYIPLMAAGASPEMSGGYYLLIACPGPASSHVIRHNKTLSMQA